MSEKVIVRMNTNFEVGFWAVNPNQPDSDDFEPVEKLHELTPYGMMLVSLANCTGQVVISYAQHHQVDLEQVEIRATYQRVFKEDCENCEGSERYDETIQEAIRFDGDLTPEQRQKLLKIARQCSIHKLFEHGIEIQSELAERSMPAS